MTTAKKVDAAATDEASAAVQSRFDKEQEQEQGFVGIKADPNPNNAYALTTGPDSPSHVSDDRTRAAQSALVDEPGKPNEIKEG